jgi:ribonuclease J
VSGKLRVLPLGGVGEIGKNLTVVEYEDRIVVVDCGLRFPTAEMMGIDLVLPDFTYLRERVDDIEAIVITHGHEDHLGALPWVLRELGQKSARSTSTCCRSAPSPTPARSRSSSCT